MEITLTASRDDLKDAATKAYADGKEIAKDVSQSLADDAKTKARELAEQAGTKAHEAAAEGRKRVRKRYGRRVKKLERRFERKLEHAARALPVDTPVDQRRRRRTAKRSAGGTLFLLALVAGLAVAYFAWKRREEAAMGPAPDAFGAPAFDDSGNGRRETATTHAPLA